MAPARRARADFQTEILKFLLAAPCFKTSPYIQVAGDKLHMDKPRGSVLVSYYVYHGYVLWP
jgi:hypothetical protein